MLYRVKCPKCGVVMDIPGPTACSCGTQLAPAEGIIYIYRMGHPNGIAAGEGIYINGAPFGHIANKQTVAYSLPYGTYNIHATLGMTRRCQDISITLSPEAPAAYVKAALKMGFWSNTIILEATTADQMPNIQ